MKRTIAAICLMAAAPLLWGAGPPPSPEPPAGVSSVGTIAPPAEPGQRLVIAGQLFAPDGKTPAPGVIVYAYQTDSAGEYRNDPRTGIARLHGWAKTDAQGRFELGTIHPGAYPGRTVPAHAHFHVWGGGYPLQWTEELLFEGDPLIQPSVLEKSRAAGRFANVCAVSRDMSATERCTINFRLLAKSNYPAGNGDPRTR
jgi:protocatechuate 3,4-dioxygenase beta subunit